ncbi:DUF4178 domain-containing protein [Sediminitomix flava]|uniref:Uncharacterized protein DUF4178 n=1 Tax=Sediminitomix flava TaxID=379075 RepID=A0A315ZG93_SEDFL|nr:DUF4178 domain-containing protein [Sediminitomix flava]PWJ44531.1 uncharacterized protein DUF4178 [Sediminitomix flava]
MPFGFFKKKKKTDEPHFDPTNIGVMDIRKGFVFDYDLKTWEVTEEFEYDWGDDYFTYEFKIVSSDETLFLSIENDDEIECQVSKKMNFSRFDEDVEESISSKGKPPRQIIWEGEVYYRDSESSGYYRNIMDENFQPFISWDYYDDTEKKVLIIEQWGEDEFEASVGKVVSPSEISNILPIS